MIEYNIGVDEDFLPTLGGPGQAGARAIMRLGAGKFYTTAFRSFSNLILVRQPLDRVILAAAKGDRAIS